MSEPDKVKWLLRAPMLDGSYSYACRFGKIAEFDSHGQARNWRTYHIVTAQMPDPTMVAARPVARVPYRRGIRWEGNMYTPPNRKPFA